MAEEVGLGTLGVIGISFMFNFGRFLAHIIYRIRLVIKKCLLKNAAKDKVVSINPETSASGSNRGLSRTPPKDNPEKFEVSGVQMIEKAHLNMNLDIIEQN